VNYPPETGYGHAPDHPSAPVPWPDGDPDHPAAPGNPDLPGYPDLPDYPDLPGYPRDAYPASGHPPTPGYPPTPDYPPASGYPPTPDYPPPGHRAAAGSQPGHPAAAHVPGGYPTADYPPAGYPRAGYPHNGSADGRWVLEGAPGAHMEHVHPADGPASGADALRARSVPAGAATAGAATAGAATADAAPVYPAPAQGPAGAQWAMLAYLMVPFFGFLVPLAIYLISMRGSRWVRAHAAQAINVWLTGVLYGLSAAIIGAMLVLDSPRVALTVVVPLITVLWLTTLAFLVRAAARAGRGESYTFPRWLCTPMVR
jgi:uncharacterized Tic20 family protein